MDDDDGYKLLLVSAIGLVLVAMVLLVFGVLIVSRIPAVYGLLVVPIVIAALGTLVAAVRILGAAWEQADPELIRTDPVISSSMLGTRDD